MPVAKLKPTILLTDHVQIEGLHDPFFKLVNWLEYLIDLRKIVFLCLLVYRDEQKYQQSDIKEPKRNSGGEKYNN